MTNLNTKKFFIFFLVIITIVLNSCSQDTASLKLVQTPQYNILRVLNYRETSKSILERYRLKLKSNIGALGIYDEFYEYQYVVTLTGFPTDGNPDKRIVNSPGYSDVYETLNSNNIYFDSTDNLPEGSSLKSRLEENKIKYIIFAPIYTSDGYLLGFVFFSFLEKPQLQEDELFNTVTLAAKEVNDLSYLLVN